MAIKITDTILCPFKAKCIDTSKVHRSLAEIGKATDINSAQALPILGAIAIILIIHLRFNDTDIGLQSCLWPGGPSIMQMHRRFLRKHTKKMAAVKCHTRRSLTRCAREKVESAVMSVICFLLRNEK